MSKFKVGDKVRTLAKPVGYDNAGYLGIGKEYVVESVFESAGTVSLVGRGQAWSEKRFELVPPDPNHTDFKVGDKVRRKTEDQGKDVGLGWPEGDRVCVVTKVHTRGDGSQSLSLEGVRDFGWDGYRFDRVEEEVTAAPQIVGLPEGYRAVRIGAPKEGEYFIGVTGAIEQSRGFDTAKCYVVLEKVVVEKVAPVFKVGDKVRLVDNTNYKEFPIGTVDTIVKTVPDLPSNGDLLEFEGPLEKSHGMYAYRFEKVVESPDDLIIQDIVPARSGVDRGWWVPEDQFGTWKANIAYAWIMYPAHAGKRHGDVLEYSKDRLVVMCYRKDLPKVEKVTLTEYVAWDDNGPKCLLWTSVNPTIESDSLGAWDHACPTGNTREIVIPLG
jgi:hypothetical protein